MLMTSGLGKKANRPKAHFRNGIWGLEKDIHHRWKKVCTRLLRGWGGGEGEVVTRNLRQEPLASLHDPPYVGQKALQKCMSCSNELLVAENGGTCPGMCEVLLL